MRLKLVTAPSGEPVTLDEAKSHLGVTDDASDSLIKGLVTAARQACEAFSRRAFITRTYDLAIDGVSGDSIELPRAPLASVTSVTYYLDDGTSGTFTDYYLDNFSEPGRIVLNRGATWPTGLRQTNGLIVRFTAGYGARADVPQGIRRAILTTVAALYAKPDPTVLEERIGDVSTKYNVTEDVPGQARALLVPYRVVML